MNAIGTAPRDIPQLRELLIFTETITLLNNGAVEGNPAQRLNKPKNNT